MFMKIADITFPADCMCLNDRLITRKSLSGREMLEFCNELTKVDKQYDEAVVFDILTMALYLGLSKSVIDEIYELPIGGVLDLTNVDIIRVSKNLCVGKYKEVEYCYNEEAVEVVPEVQEEIVQTVEEERIPLYN